MKKKQLRWLLPLAALPILWLLYWGMGRDTYVLPSPMAGLTGAGLRARHASKATPSSWPTCGKGRDPQLLGLLVHPVPHGAPVLVQTERTWDDSEVVLLGVVYQDSRANAERFLRQYRG